MVKSYHVISILNCLGKVCKKVVADRLSKWFEVNHFLHDGQMGSRRLSSTIDVIAMVVDREQRA